MADRDRAGEGGAPLVRARGLRLAFGGVEVVRGVDLDLRPREVHAILGENGAGKSSIAKMIAGVHRPTGGTIEAFGAEAPIPNPRRALEMGIALIHQEPLTFPDLSVAENIFVGHQPRRRGSVDWREMRVRADELLTSLGAKFGSDRLAGGLSVADQQTIELAAALAHDARVLLMDETTAALTPQEVAELFVVVRRLRDEGRAIAIVSHRLDEIFAIADRITVMRDGAKVAELATSETTVDEVVRLMVGREVRPARRATRRSEEPPALRIDRLSRAGAFEDVTFAVRPGEIVGLAGLVGAGRTEVCETIFGVARPTGGWIEVKGERAKIGSPRDAVRLGLAMVPEDRQHDGLLLPMTIAQNATLPTLRGTWLRMRREESVAKEATDHLRTSCRSVGQPVRELSGGNQQKVVLAKWLLTEPTVLILDEPTRGVDVGAKEGVHGIIHDLADRGVAILMVSSDLEEVLALSDRILVMREGRLVAEIEGEGATAEGVMLAATGQESRVVAA